MLVAGVASGSGTSAGLDRTGQDEAMTPEAKHIVCYHCESVNRIPVGRSAAAAKCGVCHKPLFTGHPFVMASTLWTR